MKRFTTPALLLLLLCLSLPGVLLAEVVGPTVDPEESAEEYSLETVEEYAPVERVESDEAPARKSKKSTKGGTTMTSKEERLDYHPERTASAAKGDDALPGGHVKMSGSYRIGAGGTEDDFILNDSNADLQERNFRYLFGEDLNNTYDPAIYSKYLLNVDFSPVNKINFYTQLVADPWSYVGTTGEQITPSDINPAINVRYNLKYFGAFNSTIGEIYRTHYTDSIAFPQIEVNDGHLTSGTVVHGFFDYNPATGGIPFTIPEHDIDFEFRPVRKLWMDYTEDQWHARVFMFADERQALTTDDPLELSNHKDYWQQSPWLYQYMPMQFFDKPPGSQPIGGVQRGFYSDTLSFYARDSEGNRLVLLRGASVEADLGETYFAATVASPYTPWDEDYYSSLYQNNISGAARLKHQATDQLMLGSTYTFRTGLVDGSNADVNQVGAVDMAYEFNKSVVFKGEIAGSFNEQDLLTNETIKTDREGYAYKAVLDFDYDHIHGHKLFDGHTDLFFSFTQMDQNFNPNLSRYTNTRDDNFWGNHLTFKNYGPDLEHFRLGDGIDINRYVFRINWKEKIFKERFENMFDVRNVHRTSNDKYVETVIRDEMTFKFSKKTTWKGMIRWHALPDTIKGIEPFMPDTYFIGAQDPSSLTFENLDIEDNRNANRTTYAIAMQHIFNKELTFEGFVERSNDIPSFPRGLMNGAFKNTDELIDGIFIDRVTNFLYGQAELEASPPYHYFTIVRERIIYKPEDRLTYTIHAAQNEYKFAGGIDDNINHVGVSVDLQYTKKLSFFLDYTHSQQIDVPKLIATDFSEYDYRGHHNVYGSMDYKIRPNQVFRAEYGVFGMGDNTPLVTPYSTSSFSLPTIDTEHLFRVSLTGDF